MLFNVSQVLASESHVAYLGHLEANDLGEVTGAAWNFPVVHAKDTCLIGSDAVCLDALIAKLGLVLAEGDTCDIAAIVLGCVCGEGAPSTADVEKTVFGLEVEFGADETEFVVLEVFEGGILISVNDDTRGVDHAWAKEPETCEDGEGNCFPQDTYHS
jgi:hypothetical protein